MTKYAALTTFLKNRPASEIEMSFDEIEHVIHDTLPNSASKFAQWWSNNPKNNVMTKAWLDAGYRSARVDIGARRLVFRKADAPATRALAPAPGAGDDPLAGLYGAMRGTVRLRPEVDLTLPVGEIWAADER